ncbi:MAG: ATP-binding protein, partial [Cellulomonas sp.]|nr:ATP-binding protein [Cellulomonas sp.]
RHCRPGDEVEVRVSVPAEVQVGRGAGVVVLEVQDSGPGIAAADQARVFDRYVRVGDGRMPGSGLGLAVVREFVEAHEGRVELVSAPGLGTTVTVRLPLASA